jgi:hypothetical protein
VRFLAVFLVLVCAAWFVYSRYTDPERVRRLAQAYLQQYVTGKVTVRAASFSWFDGVELLDVSISEPATPADAMPGEATWPGTVFSCERALLRHEPWPVLFGKLNIRSITAYAPHCSIVRYAVAGRTNLAFLFRSGDWDRIGDEPLILPTIELRDARFSVIHRKNGTDRIIEDLTLTIRGLPAGDGLPIFNLVWRDLRKDEGGHSRFNLATGELKDVQGGLPWMSIEAVMFAVDATYDGAGSWCDLLGLDGKVRAREYHVSAPGDAVGHRSATIELDDASLSIPINQDEEPLDRTGRYLSFERVNGTIEVTEEHMRARFTALFHGSRCEVEATLRGSMDTVRTLDDVDFTAALSVRDLQWPRPDDDALPRESRFIDRWRPLRVLYEDFDPGGTTHLQMSLAKRAGPAEPVVLEHALLTLVDTSASCSYFPYRFLNLAGQVEYTPQGVEIKDLVGHRDAGVVVINGHFDKPKLTSAAQLHISATGIPLDERLYDPLSPHHRRVWDRLDPQGKVNLDIELRRAASDTEQSKPWHSIIRAAFDDLALTYDAFPYPLEHLAGEFQVGNGLVEVRNIQAHAGDMSVGIDGTIDYHEEDLTGMDLSVVARSVSFDDRFHKALPASLREHLLPFHPTGRFDTTTVLTWDESSESIRPTAHVFLKDVAVKHDGFPVPLEGIEGALTIDEERVVLREVTGRHGQAVIEVEGEYYLAKDGGPTVLSARCKDLRIEGALRQALRDRFDESLNAWTIEGPIDATLLWQPVADGDAASELRTTVNLAGTTVKHDRLPAALTDVRGEVRLSGGRLRSDGITARYNGAAVQGRFDFATDVDNIEGTISLTASGLTLDDSVRDALPAKLREAWAFLAPSGVLDVCLDSVRFSPGGEDNRAVCSVEGRLGLRGLALSGVAGLADMRGQLHGKGLLVDRLGGVSLTGRVELENAELLDRRVTDAGASWSLYHDASGNGLFALQDLRAACYTGVLQSEFVDVHFTPEETTYRIEAAARAIDLELLLGVDTPQDPDTGEALSPHGWVDARLSLSGRVGDPRSKRGTGGLEILDTKLYRLPIILAILNYLNPTTPPDRESFDRIRARFSIVEQYMRFEDILLTGPSLAFTGSGSLGLSDRYVNLRLKPTRRESSIRIPFISEMLEGAARSLVGLRVTGPLSQPSVRAESLPGVNDTMRSLFKRKTHAPSSTTTERQ